MGSLLRSIPRPPSGAGCLLVRCAVTALAPGSLPQWLGETRLLESQAREAQRELHAFFTADTMVWAVLLFLGLPLEQVEVQKIMIFF